MDNLLAIITRVCGDVGVPVPLTLVSNADPRAITMLALAKKELSELGRSKWWPELTTFTTFNTVVSQVDYNVPADFDKIVPSTVYGTSNKWVRGALNPAQWADRLRYGSVYGVPGFRMLANKIRITPAPTVVETYAYEYKTKNRCTAADGVTMKQTFSADDDLPLLDDDLIYLGVVWRYRYSKGLEYAEDFRIYNEAVEQTYAQSLAHGDVAIGAGRPSEAEVLTEGYVPETGFGT